MLGSKHCQVLRVLISILGMRGTSGFTVLRYRVSILCGIAVFRKKTSGIAVLRYTARYAVLY